MKLIRHEDDRIVHLNFETQYQLCSSFVRIQEFYESPYARIRNQFFTLDMFMDAYVEDKGEFTYFTDWSGFNVPGNAILNFWELYRGTLDAGYRYDCNLRAKEHAVLSPVMPKLEKQEIDFYIIGTYGAIEETSKPYVDHEIAHAYYYLNHVYRRFCNEIYAELDQVVRSKVAVGLMEMGYSEQVIEDETQAYFATDDEDVLRTRFGLGDADLGDIRDRYIKNLQTVRTWKKSPF